MQLSKYVLIVAAGALSQCALAAADLVASQPANHAMLENAPSSLALEFSEPVRLAAVTLQRHGETQKQSLGPLPQGSLDRFVVAAPELTAGGYTVTWRALGEDSTVTSGEFMFMVGAMGQHDMPMNHAEHMPQGAGMDHSRTMHDMPQMQHPGSAEQHAMPGNHRMPQDSTSNDDAPAQNEAQR